MQVKEAKQQLFDKLATLPFYGMAENATGKSLKFLKSLLGDDVALARQLHKLKPEGLAKAETETFNQAKNMVRAHTPKEVDYGAVSSLGMKDVKPGAITGATVGGVGGALTPTDREETNQLTGTTTTRKGTWADTLRNSMAGAMLGGGAGAGLAAKGKLLRPIEDAGKLTAEQVLERFPKVVPIGEHSKLIETLRNFASSDKLKNFRNEIPPIELSKATSTIDQTINDLVGGIHAKPATNPFIPEVLTPELGGKMNRIIKGVGSYLEGAISPIRGATRTSVENLDAIAGTIEKAAPTIHAEYLAGRQYEELTRGMGRLKNDITTGKIKKHLLPEVIDLSKALSSGRIAQETEDAVGGKGWWKRIWGEPGRIPRGWLSAAVPGYTDEAIAALHGGYGRLGNEGLLDAIDPITGMVSPTTVRTGPMEEKMNNMLRGTHIGGF